MREGYPKITENQVTRLTASYVAESESLPLGGFYGKGEKLDDSLTRSYIELYKKVVQSADYLSGKSVQSDIWSIKNRPVLVASNQPIPKEPNNLENWNVDVGILVHADVVKDSIRPVDDAYVDVDGFIHGQGAADMKWAAIPAVAAITRAPSDLNVALIMYATEEDGFGDDIVELVNRGFKPRISLCADGGPIKDNSKDKNALISIVPNAKGAIRGRLDIDLGHHNQMHSAHLWDAPQPLIPFRQAHLLVDLENIDGPNVLHPSEENYFGRTYNLRLSTNGALNVTPSRGDIGFEIRSGSEANLIEGEGILETLAQRHGFSYNRLGLLHPFAQDIDHPTVQLFAQEARKAAGKSKVIYQRDNGSMDNRHLPEDVVRITHGIRSDYWHSNSKAEKVSIKAIMAYIKAYTNFVNKLT